MENPKPPTPEEFSALELAQAHRFPDPAHVTMIGDGGQPVRLPLVIGCPTGASKMPMGEAVSPLWSMAAGAMMKFTDAPPTDRLSFDCVLWPDRATLQRWVERWPALHDRIWNLARRKMAADASIFSEPASGEKFSDAVAGSLLQFPHAVLRRFTPTARKEAHSLLAVIDSPSLAAWRIFLDAGRKRGADYWKLINDMAAGCVRLVYDEENAKAIPFDEVAGRWPGIPVLCAMTVSVLAGMAGDSELGEF
jgi:hypothetical protein